MVLQSRKWRLLIRAAALVITSILMLLCAGPVSYALQDDTPRHIRGQAQLADKEKPVNNAYVHAIGVPDLSRSFSVEVGPDTYYWIPLRGYGNQLFVRTKDERYAAPQDLVAAANIEQQSSSYVGKVTFLQTEANSDKVVEELAKRGITIDEEAAMVLLQGEQPSTYRPMVPVMPVLAWVWLVALVGLVQIVRGKRPRRALSQAAVPAQHLGSR